MSRRRHALGLNSWQLEHRQRRWEHQTGQRTVFPAPLILAIIIILLLLAASN